MTDRTLQTRQVLSLVLLSAGWGSAAGLLVLLGLGLVAEMPVVLVSSSVFTALLSVVWTTRRRPRPRQRGGIVGWLRWYAGSLGWGTTCAFLTGAVVGGSGTATNLERTYSMNFTGTSPAELFGGGLLGVFVGYLIPVVPLLSPLVVLSWEWAARRASPDRADGANS